MTAKDLVSGLSCLFEALVALGYLAVALLLHSWVMVLAPVPVAGIIVLWAVLRSWLDKD